MIVVVPSVTIGRCNIEGCAANSVATVAVSSRSMAEVSTSGSGRTNDEGASAQVLINSRIASAEGGSTRYSTTVRLSSIE